MGEKIRCWTTQPVASKALTWALVLSVDNKNRLRKFQLALLEANSQRILAKFKLIPPPSVRMEGPEITKEQFVLQCSCKQ